MIPKAYPLQWPKGWPSTEQEKQESAKFKTELNTALNNLRRQVELLGGKSLVLSSNCTLGDENPDKCGVVAYFTWNELQVAIPCDRWDRVRHNVQAIALTIEAMRGMERWGAKNMIKAMFTGFKAIPEKTGGVSWWDTLGISSKATEDQINDAYRALAKKLHPDKGGSHEEFSQLNEAYRAATQQKVKA